MIFNKLHNNNKGIFFIPFLIIIIIVLTTAVVVQQIGDDTFLRDEQERLYDCDDSNKTILTIDPTTEQYVKVCKNEMKERVEDYKRVKGVDIAYCVGQVTGTRSCGSCDLFLEQGKAIENKFFPTQSICQTSLSDDPKKCEGDCTPVVTSVECDAKLGLELVGQTCQVTATKCEAAKGQFVQKETSSCGSIFTASGLGCKIGIVDETVVKTNECKFTSWTSYIFPLIAILLVLVLAYFNRDDLKKSFKGLTKKLK